MISIQFLVKMLWYQLDHRETGQPVPWTGNAV